MNRRIEIRRDFGDILKHEARLRLWLPVLRDLKDSLGGRYLKYFTLPGAKAYDVIRWRQEGLIEFDGRGFPNVCFCDFDADNFANAKRVLGNTHGLYAEFEKMILGRGNKKYKAFWDLFPYDVYNLDFCGTCFESDEPPVSETFLSIVELINEHIRTRRFEKCLIFLTIRIDENRTNKDVIKDLKSNLESNIGNEEFAPKIGRLMGNDINNFIRDRFHAFILISIPKLLASRVIPQRRRLSGRLESLSRAYYSRGGYQIGKFVFYVGKEKIISLRVDPAWYQQFVARSLELQNIREINPSNVSDDTRGDLNRLKEEIKQIEDYG